MFRNLKHLGRWIVIAVAIGVVCSSQALAKKPPKPPADDGGGYNLVVLAPPGVQITGSYARDLDDAGNVVGYYLDSDGERNGFHYDRSQGSWRLFGPGVVVFGLNNLGEMVGADSNGGEGLYWSAPDAPPVPLDPLDDHSISRGFNINDAGIIVGASHENGPYVAVAWRVDAEGVVSPPIELPFAEGDTWGGVSDLAEEDADGISRIVGYSGADDPYETALQWEVAVDADGLFLLSGPTDLGSLYGGRSAAFGVNSHGDIVGESVAESGNWAFVKPAGQPMQPLPGIKYATNSYAGGINDLGKMVGQQGYLLKGLIFRAVLWPDAGSVIDLNKKVALGGGEELESARVINNAGHILAGGRFPGVAEWDYDYVSCLLIPK